MAKNLSCVVELSKTAGITVKVHDDAGKIQQSLVMNGLTIVTTIEGKTHKSIITQKEKSLTFQINKGSKVLSKVHQEEEDITIDCTKFKLNAETIALNSKKDTTIIAKGKLSETSTKDMTFTSKAKGTMTSTKAMLVKSKSNKITVQGSTNALVKGNNAKLQGTMNAVVKGGTSAKMEAASVTVKGSATAKVSSPATTVGDAMTTIKGAVVKVQGALVKLG